MGPIEVGTVTLTRDDVVAVSRHGAPVNISVSAETAMAASRAQVDALAASEVAVYGISTGFGALANRHIEPSRRRDLQRSLIRSHAAGMGPVVEDEVTRALMVLRLRTLTSGRTGVRPALAHVLVGLLNAGLTPLIREYGSLGCSGDLAPLSHVALSLMGEGDVRTSAGDVVSAAVAMRAAGVEPIELVEKEGLALINGTDGMLGMLLLALHDLDMMVRTADITASMSVEALLGTDQAFLAELMNLRPHPGQALAAANMMTVLAGSPIVASHLEGDTRVQDAYSLRCAPQVHGAARDTFAYAATVAERELGSAIDNPVVLPDGRVSSNGNFHGAPVAYVLDFCAIAVADLASIAERRTDRLLDRSRSFGLPPFLAEDAGVDSGMMIAQYTQAALVHECKRLAVPSSVDSIPSSAMQEDHVSMGWSAARKLRVAVDNLARVLAVELVCSARALDLRAPLVAAAGTAAARTRLRADVAGPGPDRFLSPELELAYELVRHGDIVEAVENAVGPLHR